MAAEEATEVVEGRVDRLESKTRPLSRATRVKAFSNGSIHNGSHKPQVHLLLRRSKLEPLSDVEFWLAMWSHIPGVGGVLQGWQAGAPPVVRLRRPLFMYD